jgi:signal transduction histidine kinase
MCYQNGQLLLTNAEQVLFEESQQRRDLEEQQHIIQLAKLMSLDQLVLGIGHELNTPVAAIKSNSQFLQENVTEMQTLRAKMAQLEDECSIEWDDVLDETSKISEELCRAADDMVKLLAALSSFVRTDQSSQVIDLHSSIRIALFLLKGQLYHIKVNRDYDGSLLKVMGRPDQLIQLFISIFTDSIEAIQKRDDYTQMSPGYIQIKTRAARSESIIEICDNGADTADEDMSKTRLIIAKQLTQQLKGALNIDSKFPDNNVVTIKLPLADLEDQEWME